MRRKAAASRGWPTAPGEITHASIEESVSSDDDGPSTSYQPKIAYSYQVAGVSYEARRLTFGAQRTGSRQSAQKALDAYPAGKAVQVHYNPANPAEAVLTVEGGGTTLFLILGILLAALGLMTGCVGAVIALFAIAN